MPKRSLKGRDILSINDLTVEEIYTILELAKEFKLEGKYGKYTRLLEGKNLALIFAYESTRTRIGFEAAMHQLGGDCIYLPIRTMMAARGEPWKDTARVLDRIVDGVAARLLQEEAIYELAKYAEIPVLNASTPTDHPIQTLGELLTILEKKGRLEGLKLVYNGMTRALCHSLLLVCPKLGMDIAVSYPEVYTINEKILKMAEENAKETGAKITLTHNLKEAIKDADVVYDCILLRSYLAGEKVSDEDKIIIEKYQITSDIMKLAKEDAIFMHPGPAFRGFEVTDEVMEGPQSVVWDEVENAFYAKKAVLALVLG
ncbi:MAG TPA: ornithine carbamoyltransferase [Candidatus Bathyarchaeota archaeon]|nr:ornithine carbamoyltransferase [Candidatus Bathyarchaeota archaeon]